MKRTLVIIVNAIIIAAMLIFVVLYSRLESANAYTRQIEHFENTVVTMENVTENYLKGEQQICDVWARYINSENMTMEEAVAFIRASHVLKNASAHLILLTVSQASPRGRNRARPMTMLFPTGRSLS